MDENFIDERIFIDFHYENTIIAKSALIYEYFQCIFNNKIYISDILLQMSINNVFEQTKMYDFKIIKDIIYDVIYNIKDSSKYKFSLYISNPNETNNFDLAKVSVCFNPELSTLSTINQVIVIRKLDYLFNVIENK